MKHKDIEDIIDTIQYWSHNCGGCETCDREFGSQEEPTFDMQMVYEICNKYIDAIKICDEMGERLDKIKSRSQISEVKNFFGADPILELCNQTLENYKKFKND